MVYSIQPMVENTWYIVCGCFLFMAGPLKGLRASSKRFGRFRADPYQNYIWMPLFIDAFYTTPIPK